MIFSISYALVTFDAIIRSEKIATHPISECTLKLMKQRAVRGTSKMFTVHTVQKQRAYYSTCIQEACTVFYVACTFSLYKFICRFIVILFVIFLNLHRFN